MNPGELRHIIQIQAYSGGVDSEGYETDGWSTLCSCHASIQNMSGKEFFKAAQQNAIVTTKFTMRYSPVLDGYSTEKLRVIYDSKSYKVVYVNDKEYLHKYVEIVTELINDGS